MRILFSKYNGNKQISEKLKESELRYRRLFETAKDGILILDFETGTIVDANPYIIEIIDCPLVTKNHEVYDDELARSGKYSFRTEKIEVLELQITDWFDKKNNSQRAKGWAY